MMAGLPRCRMLENIAKNLEKWDRTFPWSKHGDEWDRQAAFCGIPYSEWKESMVRHLLAPNIRKNSHVLEIAPGHGRWTEYLVELAGHVTVVELSATCLDYCRHRFYNCRNIDYVLTTGDRLPQSAANQIDFVWSYDSFVHMDRTVISAYLGEIRRVLKIGGTAIIYHSNVDDPANHVQDTAPGWQSAMSAELMRQLAVDAGLSIVSQFAYWDEENKVGSPRHNGRFTRLTRNTE